MRKIVALLLLAGYVWSCAPQGSYSQTWLPRQHKRVDLSKPLKKR